MQSPLDPVLEFLILPGRSFHSSLAAAVSDVHKQNSHLHKRFELPREIRALKKSPCAN